MAGLDTSIPLGVKPIDFGDPNEGRMNALRSQIMQMQMQQGQFNMMKAQRDMQYEDRQRAIAAAAVARDKAAEAQAFKLYGQTGAPGYQSYSPSMEPGAASDVGMMGGDQGYTEGAINRLAVPAQPKNFDDAIANALAKGDAASILAARKLMALKEAENTYKKSNLGVDEATAKTKEAGSKAASAEIELFNKQYAPHRAALVNVTSPEEAAAWTSSMYDQPTFGDMMKKLGMSKEQAIAQSAQKFAENPQAWIVSQMNLDGEKAHKLVYGEGKDKKESDVATLIRERNSLNKTSPTYAQDLEIYNDRIEKATNIKGGGGGTELKPAEKFKIEQGLNKSYSATTAILDTLEDAHDAVQNVQGSNIAGTTGFSAYLPSIPGGAAATSENRMKTLEGKVTALGKASAASTGAIGSIATQEWKILRDMVASLDPSKGEKAYREQLDNVEAQLQGAKNRVRDAYEKAHVDTLKRPEFQQYGALPEPRERGGVMPGSNPVAQKPAINRVQPNTPAGGARVPAGAAGATPTNAKGWVLHTDANGNKAYVSPDGKSFEEVK